MPLTKVPTDMFETGAVLQISNTQTGAVATGTTTSADVDSAPSSSHGDQYMTAGTTSAITFKVRIGSTGAGTTTFNGSSGGRKLGGVMDSSITITEIAA